MKHLFPLQSEQPMKGYDHGSSVPSESLQTITKHQ